MTSRLSEAIREGFRAAVGSAGASVSPVELRARARDLSLTRPERDAVIRSAVIAYQQGDRQLWAPVILELLAPAIMHLRLRFGVVPPVILDEDIGQELLAEVLRAAIRLRVDESSLYVERRIILRATTRLMRWLAKEGRVRNWKSGPLVEGEVQ